MHKADHARDGQSDPAPVRADDGHSDWIVPAIIGVAVLMQTLSATVVINALPAMARSLHVPPLTLNLAVTIYMIAVAAALPITGWMADRFGARRIFMAAIGLYALSSAAAGMSQSLTALLAARFVQGVASSALLPIGRLILLRTRSKSQFVDSLAIVSMATLLGPLLGPIVGGALVTFADWRWIFFINLPLAAIGLPLVGRYIPEIREHRSGSLDIVGALLAAVAMAAFIVAFEQLKDYNGLVAVAAPATLGIVALLAYGRHSSRHRDAIVDLSIFRFQSFSAAVVGGGFFRLAMGANSFLLVMLLQLGFGFSAFRTGCVMAAGAAGALAMKFLARPLLRRLGFRTLLIANASLLGLMFMAPAFFGAHWPPGAMMVALAFAGFLQSLQMLCVNGLAYSDIDQTQMSAATTTAAMCQQLVQSVGIALAAALLGLTQSWHGTHVFAPGVVAPTFIVMGLASMLSLWWFVRLPAGVGAEMSGH